MATTHLDNQSSEDLTAILTEIDRTLNHLAGAGCRGFDCSPQTLAILDGWLKPLAPTAETLTAIRQDLGECQRCALAAKRRNIVYGAGDAAARLVFIGEGPGYEEDQQGLPFVGAAGQLLTKIIAAIKLSREDVYICNIIKCRPPGNRNPKADEIKTCLPFLERQVAAIQPEFICALGTVAAQALLGTSTPISRLRGTFHDYHGIKLLPTFHPAYLLRNPDKKRAVWEDMQILMRAMGTPLV